MQDETVIWFKSLNTGISITSVFEIERLVSVRSQMFEIHNNCKEIITVAVRFAMSKTPNTVSRFCSLLKLVVGIYIDERNNSLIEYEVIFKTEKNKPNKIKWVGK